MVPLPCCLKPTSFERRKPKWKKKEKNRSKIKMCEGASVQGEAIDEERRTETASYKYSVVRCRAWHTMKFVLCAAAASVCCFLNDLAWAFERRHMLHAKVLQYCWFNSTLFFFFRIVKCIRVGEYLRAGVGGGVSLSRSHSLKYFALCIFWRLSR